MAEITASPADNGIPGAIQLPPGTNATSIDDNGTAHTAAGKMVGHVTQTDQPAQNSGSDFFSQFGGQEVQPQAQSQPAESGDFFSKFGGQEVAPTSGPAAQEAQPEKPGIIRRALESVGMTPEALEAQQQEMQAHPVKSVLENSMPAIGAAQGIYQWGKKRVENIRNEAKEAEEAVQNIREGGSVKDNIAKLAHGVLTGETSSVPFIGDPALTVGQDYHEGNYRGAVGGLVGILGQTVLPEIAPEAIAGVRGAFSPEYALKAATESHAATSITHQARTAEADVAARQAAQTTDVAERARQAEQAGTGTRDQTVQAENTASEAVANHNKAQKALAEASDAQKQSALDLKKANDRLVEKNTPKTEPDKTGPAVDKFKQAFEDKRHPLSDNDVKIALAHVAEDHAATPFENSRHMADALDKAEDRIDDNVKQAAAPHLDQPIATNPLEDITHALEPANQQESGWTSRGLASIEDFNLKDPTIGESMKLVTRLNDQLRGIQKKNMWDLRTSLANSPEYAAKFALRDSLRTGVSDALEDLGVKNIKQARSEQAAVINVRDAVDNKANQGSQKVRGTTEATPRRQTIAKYAPQAGKVVGGTLGAGIGGAFGGGEGAIAGGWLGKEVGSGLGKMIGERIAPSDFTRDQIAVNAADQAKNLKTKLAEVSTAPARPLPVDDIPPAVSQALSPDEMRQLMREQTPIHAALASHYGESVADTSYRDLEDKFVNDIQDKKLHGIALEPDEKKLNAQLNEQHLADQDLLRTKAQQVAEQQETAPPEPTATLPRNAEPLLQGPKVHNGMGMREALTHDLVHAVVADQLLGDKLPSVGIRSHLHPENGGNHIASTAFDWSNFVDEDGNIDPDKISKNIDDIAAMYVSGGVANDLWHGVPLGENLHLGADIRSIEKLMNAVDIPKKRQAEIIAAAGSKVRDILEQPGFEQAIHDHASVREPNLDPTMHFSKDRIQQVIEDLKGGDNGDLEPTAGAGKSDRKSEEGPAGRSGKGTDKQAKAESKDQLVKDSSGSKEGPDENKASSSEVKSAKPALTRDEQVGEEFKQAFSHENLKDAVTKGYVDSAWDRIEQGKKVLFSDKPGSLESKIQSAVDSGKIKSKEDLQSFIKPENPKFSEPDLKYQHRENQMGGDATLEDNEGTKGYLAYVRDGDNAHVASSMILDDKLQGKGNGREMYEKTAEALRDKGVKNFTSDTAVSPQATRVWESLEKKHPDEITRSTEDGKPKFTWKLNLDPDGDEFRAAVAPPELTTGVPESDEAIKAGGGVPGGSMGGREGLAMFHSPETGSTLALKHADLTPERVKAHIEASNKLFKPENPKFAAEDEFTHDPKQFVNKDMLPEDEDSHGLFHVTTAKDKVLAEGLKSRKQTGATGLGGGWNNQAPGMVSTTFDAGHASQIHDRITLAAKAARDEVTPQQALDSMISDAQLSDDTPEEVGRALGAPDSALEDWEDFNNWFEKEYPKGDAYRVVQELDDKLSEIYPGADYPVRVGFTDSKEQMAKVDPSQISTLKVEAKKSAKPTHIPDESELRFNPEDLRVMKDENDTGRVNEPVKPENPKFDSNNENPSLPLDKLTIEHTPDYQGGGGHMIEAFTPNRRRTPYSPNEAPVGYLELGKNKKGYTYVQDVSVEDNYRGTGLGQKLYDEAVAQAKKQGATRLYASADQTGSAKSAWNRLAKRYPVKQDGGTKYVDLIGDNPDIFKPLKGTK